MRMRSEGYCTWSVCVSVCQTLSGEERVWLGIYNILGYTTCMAFSSGVYVNQVLIAFHSECESMHGTYGGREN